MTKKHKTYKPKSLSKEEQEYLNSQLKHELIMSVIVLLAGIAVVVALFALTKQAAGL